MSAWGVGEYHDPVAELRYIDKIQCGSVFDCLKHVLASSYGDWRHQEVELVDQTVLHQGGIEWTIPVLDDVAARLLFQVRHERGHIPADDGGIPHCLSKSR